MSKTFLDTSVNDAELVCADWSILRRYRGPLCGGVLSYVNDLKGVGVREVLVTSIEGVVPMDTIPHWISR